MVTIDKHRRDQWTKFRAMFPIHDDVAGISELYVGRGSSFAVVRHGNDFDRDGFIALTPRHMLTRNWRGLYWLGVKRLVVYGREMGTLCDSCFNTIPCLQAGRDRNASFTCRVTEELLTIKTSRREHGRDKDGFGSP